MTRVTHYSKVVLSRIGINRTMMRTEDGQKLMKYVGQCIEQGGHVEMKTHQDNVTGTEWAQATLYWKEHPHVTLARHRRGHGRAND